MNAGKQLEALRLILGRDSILRELATTPLMLSVMALAYHGKDVKDILIEDCSALEQLGPSADFIDASQRAPLLNAQRREVFATYVQHMLYRRGSCGQYPPQQTIYWLAGLARSTREIRETGFLYPQWLLHQGWPRRIHNTANIISRILSLVALLSFGVLAFRWPSFFLIFPGLASIAIGALIAFGIKWINSEMDRQKVANARIGITLSILSIILITICPPFFLPFFSQRSFLILSDMVISESPLLVALLASFPFLLSRMLFCLYGYIPWNSKSFLEYTVERIFLRKVGKNYIFIHSLLRDYFASLDINGPIKTKTRFHAN